MVFLNAMITTICPPWEYENVPNYDAFLTARTTATLVRLRDLSPEEKILIAKDTRTVHQQYFSSLTPAGFDYYAGHYRGEDFICLKDSRVGIKNDSLVGHPPDRIATDMANLANDLTDAVAHGDITWAANRLVITPPEKLYRIVQLAVALFVHFLQIHPFLNGNGHMARFFLMTFLSRYGVFLSKFPLHPRPQDPPYSECIARYRRGDRRPLEHFVLSCI
jgi:fido (protein-threonine AMPylation protein)